MSQPHGLMGAMGAVFVAAGWGEPGHRMTSDQAQAYTYFLSCEQAMASKTLFLTELPSLVRLRHTKKCLRARSVHTSTILANLMVGHACRV